MHQQGFSKILTILVVFGILFAYFSQNPIPFDDQIGSFFSRILVKKNYQSVDEALTDGSYKLYSSQGFENLTNLTRPNLELQVYESKVNKFNNDQATHIYIDKKTGIFWVQDFSQAGETNTSKWYGPFIIRKINPD